MRSFLLLIALFLAGAAVWLWLGSPTTVPQPTPVASAPAAALSPPSSVVLVATRDLPQGQQLVAADVSWAAPPAGSQATGLIQQTSMPDAIDRVAGLATQTPIAAGEPILWDRLSSSGETPLSALIAPGKYALAIIVSEATAAGGLIRPGDRVDLLTAARNPSGVTVIAADIAVLAVDQITTGSAGRSQGTAQPARTLTLELDASGVGIVGAAVASGGVIVALRSSATAP